MSPPQYPTSPTDVNTTTVGSASMGGPRVRSLTRISASPVFPAARRPVPRSGAPSHSRRSPRCVLLVRPPTHEPPVLRTPHGRDELLVIEPRQLLQSLDQFL